MSDEARPVAGSPVLLRYVLSGRVRAAYAHRLVAHDGDRIVLYLAAGTPGMRFAGSRLHDADDLERYDWSLAAVPWQRTNRLSLVRLGAAHALDLFWAAETWEFLGWYVNLQSPLRRTELGFDTRDHALDVTVAPDGSWQWKDEADLAAAVRLGLFADEEVGEIRQEAERVVASLPDLLPTGWEGWRPDPAWTLPPLPAGWNHL